MTNEDDAADPASVARAIIGAGLYMTLGTADEAGRPWVSPVYYAAAGQTEFFWISSPDARHSRNLEVRPELSIVIFDTGAPIGTGQGVYMAAVADRPADAALDRGIEVFSETSQRHGGRPWSRDDVLAPARHRLYRATVSEHFVLGARDERVRVRL